MEITTIFRQSAFNRGFEIECERLVKEGKVKIPVYLSLGTETIPPQIFDKIGKDYAVFPQHRCHSWYLSFGGDPVLLARELLGRKDGCNEGYGGSASISCDNFWGHSGLLGDQIPIACGYAHASQKPTLCIFGDAAAEEDYVLAGLGYAATKKLPILFVCEDNDLSILTRKETRRSWDLVEVARGFGLNAIEIYDYQINYLLENNIIEKLPLLINVKCQRECWHSGVGRDSGLSWNTYERLKNQNPMFVDLEKDEFDKAKKTWEIAQT